MRSPTRRQILRDALVGATSLAAASRASAQSDEAARMHPAIQLLDKTDAYGGQRTNLKFEEHVGFILLPAHGEEPAQRSWVWYAPTLPGLPSPRHDFIFRKALAAGMAIAGLDVGESYGSPAGVNIYSKFHDALVKQFRLEEKAILLPQSRGGLMLFNYAEDHPADVARIAGIYTVCDLRSYPGLASAAPAYALSEKQLADDLPRSNPIDRVALLAKAGIPVLLIHGDNDRVVPLENNSAEFQRRYQAAHGPIELIVVPGKGHEEVDEFFTSDRFVNFLLHGPDSSGKNTMVPSKP